MDPQELERLRESIKMFQDNLDSLNTGMEKSEKTFSDQLGKKFPNAAKPAAAAMEGLTHAFTDVTKALYRGERGLSVMANGLDKMVDGVQTAVAVFTLFTPMGRAMGTFTKILVNGIPMIMKLFSSANKLNAEQSDKLFQAYKNLSEFGGIAVGLEEFNDQLLRAGFTVAEIDQFGAVMRKNAKDLTLLGATAGKGAERLSEISGTIIKSPLGRGLEMLGMSAESVANSTMTYISLQTRLGRIQGKTNEQLAQEGAKFALELDKMARLTGQTREEQEQARKALMEDERYAAFMAGEAREQGYDVQALESFFGMIQDPETRKGLQHLMAGGGAATSEEARRVMFTDPQAFERMMAVATGRSSAVQAIEQFAKQQGEYTKTFAGLTRYTGEGPGVRFGGRGGAVMASEQIAAMQDAAKKAGMTLDQFVTSEQGRLMMNEGALKQQVDTRREQAGYAQSLDKTVNSLNFFQSAANTAASALNKLSDLLLGKVPGGKPATGGVGAPGAAAAPGLAGLRDMIAAKESGGNYNVMVGGKTADLTNMTIAQVMELQRQQVAAGGGSAAGKYQIINKTLEGLVKEGGIDTSAKFDQAMQDKLADMLLKRRGLTEFQTGKISKEEFAKRLSQEWAALPSGPSGKSYYEGVGNNKAHYSWEQMMQNLGSVAPGIGGAAGWDGRMTGPMSGYRPNILMHGDESISIRPTGREATPDTGSSEGMLLRLVEETKETNYLIKGLLGVNEKILRAQA